MIVAILGWKLDEAQRTLLLLRFPPSWPDVVADHVTLGFAAADAPLPPPVAQAAIVGESDDGAGVQAMVVAIDGRTDRPDGRTWHLTWSLDRGRGRRAMESNAVIAEYGWRPLAVPEPIRLTPARWD